MISGSVAALLSTVRPSASAAVSSTVSVAPTDGYGRVIWGPTSRPATLARTPSSVSVTSAPKARRASTWKSTGRAPMRSPPTTGTKASWWRCSSGPSSRIGMRLSPEYRSGTSGTISSPGVIVIVSPSRSTPTPRDCSTSVVMPTSPTSGTLWIVEGELPMTAATMCLVMAFFDPATRTSPRSGPEGSTAQAVAGASDAGGVMERVYGRSSRPLPAGTVPAAAPRRSGSGRGTALSGRRRGPRSWRPGRPAPRPRCRRCRRPARRR